MYVCKKRKKKQVNKGDRKLKRFTGSILNIFGTVSDSNPDVLMSVKPEVEGFDPKQTLKCFSDRSPSRDYKHTDTCIQTAVEFVFVYCVCPHQINHK